MNLALSTADGLTLEGVLDEPEGPRAVLVLCHPHPKMGGTMKAPLLLAIRDRVLTDGWAVLRFNFRGIGASEGEPSIGIEELQDTRAALSEASARFPGLPVALAGWSFGAAVATKVASTEDVVALVGIAPAIRQKPDITAGLPDPSETRLAMPGLFIVGENDDLVEPDDVEGWARLAGIETQRVAGANHFFWGKYEDLADRVATFLGGALED